MATFNPILAVREFLKTGGWIAEPIVGPIVFAAAAQIKSLSYQEFLESTTKRANSLEEINRYLCSTLVISHWGTFLEAEALGSVVDLSDFPGRITKKSIKSVPTSAEDLAGRGRFPASLDVTRRLNLRIGSRALIGVGVTAPFTLLRQCTESEAIGGSRGSREEILSKLANVVLWAAVNFCKAGAKVVVLVDEILPSPEELADYAWILEPIVNAIRFYEAVPLYMATKADLASVPGLAKQLRDIVPLLPLPLGEDKVGEDAVALGLRLGNLEETEVEKGGQLSLPRERVLMLTTYGELPFDFEVARLKELGRLLQSSAASCMVRLHRPQLRSADPRCVKSSYIKDSR